CMAVRREVFDEMGVFDDASFPRGYGEENDFCLRAAAAGFVGAVALDTYVFHAKSRSYGPTLRAELVRAAGDALRRKWSPQRVAEAEVASRDNPDLADLRRRLRAVLGVGG